jgi:hypothetical protein
MFEFIYEIWCITDAFFAQFILYDDDNNTIDDDDDDDDDVDDDVDDGLVTQT